jgi:hypothetical protein
MTEQAKDEIFSSLDQKAQEHMGFVATALKHHSSRCRNSLS